jgi:hypothetical protein
LERAPQAFEPFNQGENRMNAKAEFSLETQRDALNARFHGVQDDTANTLARIAALQQETTTGKPGVEEKLTAEQVRLASLKADRDAIHLAHRKIEAEIHARDAAQAAAARAAREVLLGQAIDKAVQAGAAVDSAVDALCDSLRNAHSALNDILEFGPSDPIVDSEVRDRISALVKNAKSRLAHHFGGHSELGAPDMRYPAISLGERSADVLARRKALGVKNV